MRFGFFTAVLAFAALLPSSVSADVHLRIDNGQVTLSATDATVPQILTEWARVGQTKIVNAERIPGGPVNLELTNVPETEALQIVLRSVSGYVCAPRAQSIANASQFDRIVVMPTSSPARPVASPAPPPAFQQPPFTPPIPPQQQIEDEDNDGPAPAAPPNTPPQNPRGPIFNTFPQGPQNRPVAPVQPPPQQPTGPTSYPAPTAPVVGVAVPGMVVPTPAQPNQPGQPGVVPPPPQRAP